VPFIVNACSAAIGCSLLTEIGAGALRGKVSWSMTATVGADARARMSSRLLNLG
jgi:hypothetical protein